MMSTDSMRIFWGGCKIDTMLIIEQTKHRTYAFAGYYGPNEAVIYLPELKLKLLVNGQQLTERLRAARRKYLKDQKLKDW
jgi:hypothetical protein